MREIKFRAWDKKHNEMVPDLICFYKDGGISHNNHFNSDTAPFRGYMWDSRNIEIMQYTGLKDKNGMGLTEVYEGDIISIDGTLKGSIYENKKEPTDIIIPQLGTEAWNDAYKEAVARGYDYSE